MAYDSIGSIELKPGQCIWIESWEGLPIIIGQASRSPGTRDPLRLEPYRVAVGVPRKDVE